MSYSMIAAVARRTVGRRQQAPSTPGPVSLPAYWGFYGDSQTAGPETEPTAVSPPVIFEIIWGDSGYAAPTSVTIDGVGGRWLAATRTAYEADSYAGTPWIHVQESGNQNQDGQRTASEWGDTFQSFMQAIATDYPGALITYETAYSFEREADAYRNWTSYNVELYSRVATLAGLGVDVIVVDTDTNIKALVTELTYDVVCFPDNATDAYHYQGIGNLMIALTMFDALGYDVTALDLSGVNVLEAHKTAAIVVITG